MSNDALSNILSLIKESQQEILDENFDDLQYFDPYASPYDWTAVCCLQCLIIMKETKQLFLFLNRQFEESEEFEINQLQYLNQFKSAYLTIISRNREIDSNLITKVFLYAYLIFGIVDIDKLGLEFIMHQNNGRLMHYENLVLQIQQENIILEGDHPFMMHHIDIIQQLETQFLTFDAKHLKQYVADHRRQAYLFQFFSLNTLLIEMDVLQMCHILSLPTDYFTEYYHTVLETLSQLGQEIVNRMRKDEFEHYVSNGIIKAIVNRKVKLYDLDYVKFQKNDRPSEYVTGVIDAQLIHRRIKKLNDYELLSDMIYDTLNYKI